MVSLENIMLSETGQVQKDKYIIPLTWNIIAKPTESKWVSEGKWVSERKWEVTRGGMEAGVGVTA